MENEFSFSGKQKLIFFLIAVCSMLLLGAASVSMAAGRYALCVLLFVCAFLLIGFGFMLRKKYRG